MRRLVLLNLLAAFLALASPERSSASCPSGKCPDQLAVDDLRARIAARCDCAGARRREWTRCVKQMTDEAVASGVVPRGCAKAVRTCEANTTCGRAGAVVCCDTTRKGVLQARVVRGAGRCRGTACPANPSAVDACRPDATCGPPPRRDPGTAEWQPVPEDRIAEECRLEPALLREANTT